MAGLVQEIQYRTDSSANQIHFHHAYEMIFIRSGSASLKINNSEYLVQRDSIAFISNLEEHSTTILTQPYTRYFVILEPQQADRLLAQPQLLAMFKNRPQNFCHVVDVSQAAGVLESLLGTLLKLQETPLELKDELQAAVLTQALIYVYNSPQYRPASINSHPEVLTVQKYIDEHFTQDLRISEIAASFYVDHCHLTHTFKQVTGYSPKQYLLLNRLSYAKKLLLQTGETISQVAEAAGFGDVNNFIRFFKREFGVTPRKYRELKKN